MGLDLRVIWENKNLDKGTSSMRFVDGEEKGQADLAMLLDTGKISVLST